MTYHTHVHGLGSRPTVGAAGDRVPIFQTAMVIVRYFAVVLSQILR